MTPQDPTDRPRTPLSEWVFSAAVVLGCLLVLWSSAKRIALPYQVNYEEGNILNAALRITQGESPYPAPSERLYVFNPYGPVFYYSVAWLVKLFGVGFTYLRLYVLGSALLVCLLLSLLLRRWTGSWRLGLTFGFLYLCLRTVQDWSSVLRVDFVGLAFALGGLWVCAAYPRLWYASVPLFVAGIFCKYTLLAAPGACLLLFLLQKEWRKAIGFLAASASLAVLGFVAVQSATGGWFAFHMFGTHPDPFSAARYPKLIFLALIYSLPLTLLAIAFAVQELSRRKASLPLLYLALCTLTALTAGKTGSVENHLLEWLAALCLCAGLGHHWLRAQPRETHTATFASLALAVVVALALPLGSKPDARRAGCAQAYAYVKDHPGQRLLSENVGALVLAGKPVLMSNPFVYGQLVSASGWPDEPLNKLVRARYFDAILVDGDIEYLKHKANERLTPNARWPLSFVIALEQNYQPVRQFACEEANVAFEPRGARASE